MKKFTFCAIALAAVTFAFTSCNKEEGAVIPGDINAITETNEIVNEAKTHIVYDSILFWDEGDKICISDASNNSATYEATRGGGHTHFRFVRHTNPARPFDENNGNLYAVYPTSIGNGTNNAKVKLPEVQMTNTGALEQFPMVGTGAIDDFHFRNICGVVKLHLTSNTTIDSIRITTDKYVAGYFNVNFANESYPISYYVTEKGFGHGSKSVTLKFRNGLQNARNQEVCFYLPAADYETFEFTFFSGNTKKVLRSNGTVSISRTQHTHVTLNLTGATFQEYVYGATTGIFKVSANTYVRFAQGNLQYIGIDGNNAYWRFADNQYDFYTTAQTGKGYGYVNTDRDIFAWGANGWGRNLGNGIKVWGTDYRFEACSATTLSGNNEWGNNAIRNAANVSWRTLSSTELNYLRRNHTYVFVQLFNGIQGALVLPYGVNQTVSPILTRSQYNSFMSMGALFLPQGKIRIETGCRSNGVYTYANQNEYLYWTSDINSILAMTDYTANCGAYVRLATNVDAE